MSAGPDFLSAFRRCDQAFAAQLGAPQALGCALAYCAADFPLLPDANQVRDVLLLEHAPEAALAAVDAHFAALERRCLRWSLSSEQPAEPIGSLLEPRGWSRRIRTVLGLESWPPLDALHPAADDTPGGFRILPARAMRKAYRRAFLDAAAPDAAQHLASPGQAAQRADAALERLNDPELDAFVAVLADEPVGRVALLSAGDVCRVHDPHLTPEHQSDRRIAAALLRHVLNLAHRLRPRAVVAEAPDSPGSPWRELLEHDGFRDAGSLIEWTRSPA